MAATAKPGPWRVGLAAAALALGLAGPAAALHQIAGYDFDRADDGVVEFLPPQPPRPTTTSATSPTTRPTTTRSTTTCTTTSTQPAVVDPVLRHDGQWLLPAVAVPHAAAATLEDLLWVRFEGDDFGRSREWDGRVELVAYDAGGPRVAVRCSSTRKDGVVQVHDGQRWQRTGLILRSGVDYLIRTVYRADKSQTDVALLESSEPAEVRPVPAGRYATTSPTSTQSTRPSTAPVRERADQPSQTTHVRPRLAAARQLTVAASVPTPPFSRPTVRRLFRVAGKPNFATVLRRWQLWDVSQSGRPAMHRTCDETIVELPVGNAPTLTGQAQLQSGSKGSRVVSFRRRVGLQEDFRSPAGWPDLPDDRIVQEQGGPVLVVSGIGSLGAGVRRAFLPPRVPFELRIIFKMPPDAPALRTIDLVRMIRRDTETTIGPYVQLLSGMHDLGSGKWAARLAAQVGEPNPVIDGNPIQLDTWYEVRLAVDPLDGTYTASLTTLGSDKPDDLYRPTTRVASAPTTAKPDAKPPDKNPAPKPVPMFGGAAQKFFGLTRLPDEMALLLVAEGAYRMLGAPVELAARPSFVLPVPDNTRPWTNPATMTDMTCRNGRLEILNTHGGASLLTLDLMDGTLSFEEKAFGLRAGQALAWDQTLGCYWLVQPVGRFLLERRWPAHRAVEMFLPAATTQPARRFEIPPAPGQVTLDGDLKEWTDAVACGPLTDDVAQIGIRDCTFLAMYDSSRLYLAAEVHDPDALRNLAVPSSRTFATGDLIAFHFGGTDTDASWRPATQSTAPRHTASLYLWYNHQQKMQYAVRVAHPDARQPSTAPTTGLAQDVQMKLVPWPDNHPLGKGYTLEAAVPWQSLKLGVTPEPGRTLSLSAVCVWGDANGGKAVASIAALGGSDPNGQADPTRPPELYGVAVLLPQGRPMEQRRSDVVPLHANGRLAVTGKDVFFATWEKGIYRLAGKTGQPNEFDYRKAFEPNIRFAGVSADQRTLLLAGPYGAPNAATILAVDLASGQPIQRFSLRRYVQGITSLATDGKQLYALAPQDRMIVSCDWPGPRRLGLTGPALMVGRIDILPTHAVTRQDLIEPGAKPQNLSGSISEVKDAKTGTVRYKVQDAAIAFPKPTIVPGDTLGQFRTMQLRLHPVGPAQALRIALQPKPVGKPVSVYVAVLDEASAATWPLPNRRTTAKAFFASPEYVRDAKSPLRQFKPPGDDEPVIMIPAGNQPADLDVDLIRDFGLAANSWVGQIQLQSIGPQCEIERLSVRASDTVHAGPAEGVIVGDVMDLGRAGSQLLDWESDLNPPDRDGDELRLSIRSADDRTELVDCPWQLLPEPWATGPTPDSQPTTTRARRTWPLAQFVQWRLELKSVHVQEPPTVSTVRLILAGSGPAEMVAARRPQPARSWRTWWPVIFAAPVASYLIWFAFLRRKPKRRPDGQKAR